ncbi:uncharacterized protein LOC127807716 [Diospyros lotus]|uniref:uncharacterized protein LOC127807716 n=1 Tax=Diospyros lotus TaxID=55363 RepID=UPI00225BA54B|nr:uncharacterized protein LOC127807716 [Diospyros lotus]
MARPFFVHRHLSGIPQAVAYAAASLLLCAFALFLCASHSLKWRRWRPCYGRGCNHDPVIQLNNEAMVAGFHFGNGEGSMPSSELSVWQRNILMGGKCQLPDFSGVIIYDAAGNVASPAKPSRALTWK